jgi:hypothetical protein
MKNFLLLLCFALLASSQNEVPLDMRRNFHEIVLNARIGGPEKIVKILEMKEKQENFKFTREEDEIIEKSRKEVIRLTFP